MLVYTLPIMSIAPKFCTVYKTFTIVKYINFTFNTIYYKWKLGKIIYTNNILKYDLTKNHMISVANNKYFRSVLNVNAYDYSLFTKLKKVLSDPISMAFLYKA